MKSEINSIFRHSPCKRIYQGDIYKDLTIIDYEFNVDENKPDIYKLIIPYLVVMSQDCDLEQNCLKKTKHKGFKKEELDDILKKIDEKGYEDAYAKHKEDFVKLSRMHDKFIPSILTCQAFPAEQVRVGSHLLDYNLLMDHKGKKKSTSWRNILRNETPRYHYIIGNDNFNVPNLVLDFKRFYTIPINYFKFKFKDHYLTSINELVREEISRRFLNYQSRIGLPF